MNFSNYSKYISVAVYRIKCYYPTDTIEIDGGMESYQDSIRFTFIIIGFILQDIEKPTGETQRKIRIRIRKKEPTTHTITSK